MAYHVYPRSFANSDSNSYGVGDPDGLTGRPDHVADLGAGWRARGAGAAKVWRAREVGFDLPAICRWPSVMCTGRGRPVTGRAAIGQLKGLVVRERGQG